MPIYGNMVYISLNMPDTTLKMQYRHIFWPTEPTKVYLLLFMQDSLLPIFGDGWIYCGESSVYSMSTLNSSWGIIFWKARKQSKELQSWQGNLAVFRKVRKNCLLSLENLNMGQQTIQVVYLKSVNKHQILDK